MRDGQAAVSYVTTSGWEFTKWFSSAVEYLTCPQAYDLQAVNYLVVKHSDTAICL